jgi:probable addiction module antidote protein
MKTAAPLDISELLDTEAKISAYLSAIIEDNDYGLLLQAIGHIAKARGISKIAETTGLGRESLYKSFAENAQPKFDTVVRVLNAMNISIQFTSRETDAVVVKKPRRALSRAKPSKLNRMLKNS